MIATHRIDLTPAFRQKPDKTYTGQGMAFMSYQGQPIGESKQPLFAAARWLLANGRALPGDRVQTYRSGVLCMTGPVDVAAGLTVLEPDSGGLRFARYKPFPPGMRARASSPPIEGHLPLRGSAEECVYGAES